MIDNDEAIVRAVQTGDTEAFAKLVDRHKERLFAVLVRLTGDAQAAEEMAHDTFVRAYRGLDRFRGEAAFGTWLIQIAVHLARDRVRERRRSRTVSLDALLEIDRDTPLLAETRPAYDPLAELSERDMTERFESALQELPPSYREAFLLRHIQEMPYEAMASATGDTVGSLKVRVHRARKILKEKLFPDTARFAEDVIE
jgi:RNA polymerase sigma-70 factor (ECF subfamily)